MASIPKKEIPGYVRRCYDQWQKANKRNRDAEIERLKFYAGGDLQWRDEELQKRRQRQRPWITINRVKPAVDQVEGDIRINPPGPQCHPVGNGADADTADIIDGLIRETEYRSGAKTCYATAGKYVAASGYAVMELASEYTDDRSFSQRLVINSVEDPSTVFFDPTARMANRQDAAWAGKIKMYSKSEYMAAFGNNRKVLKGRATQSTMGWIQEALGVDGDYAQVNEWTGERSQGPYYVVEFYMVEIDKERLRLFSDDVARYDDEPVPSGVTPREGEEYTREVPRRKIVKYVVDALEILDETEWLGTLIPLFPVLGPEVYIDGKLHRLSLISGAIDAQRALNYVATTATEIAGLMPKSPWIGYKGQFDDPKWQTANSEVWAYLEVTPQFATDEMGQQQILPPPQRNQWEAPIQWILALAGYFSDAIKAVTSVYDPSLGSNKGDQSGKAIEQLRSESNVGNFSYADNLHRAIEVMYGEMCCIFPKIMDGPRAATIVRADSQHEIVQINQDFSKSNGIDHTTGKKGKANNICLGQYSVRVTVGPSFQTRQENAIAAVTDAMKANPQMFSNPAVFSMFMRWIGEGNPKVEQIADLIAPPPAGDASPQMLQQQLQQAQMAGQQMQKVIQALQQALAAKLPEIEAKKQMNALDNLTRIHVAEVSASKDADNSAAEREAAQLESMMNMAHDVALQQSQHENTLAQQSSQNQAAMQQSDQSHQQTMEQQAAAQEAEPAGAEK